MKRFLLVVLIAAFALAPTIAQAFRLYFTPVTTYTDGTQIEAQFRPVLYDAWVDGQVLATGATASPINLIDNTFGATHTYRLQSRLSDGRKSDNVVVTLSNPLDSRLPNHPAAPYSIGN